MYVVYIMELLNAVENVLSGSRNIGPKTIEDTILPAELKETFQQFIKGGNVPNMILSGRAGVGKTTVARALYWKNLDVLIW